MTRELWICRPDDTDYRDMMLMAPKDEWGISNYFHFREVKPIDWDYVWTHLKGSIPTEFNRKNIQQLIEEQLTK